jgi:hypothetical protein
MIPVQAFSSLLSTGSAWNVPPFIAMVDAGRDDDSTVEPAA